MSNLWRRLYDAVLRGAQHRHAKWYLATLSFAESSFFPIPPDVMLAPMVLAQRAQAWRLAALTTAASVIGGIAGYFIGAFAIGWVQPWLVSMGHWEHYLAVQVWFQDWGFWAILLAGFSPIPYKVFTIAAGAGSMLLLPFVAASLVGRGARFFLVAGLVRWAGPVFEQRMLKYIDVMGWALVALILLGGAAYTLL